MKTTTVAIFFWYMSIIAFAVLHRFYTPDYNVAVAVTALLLIVGVILLLAVLTEGKHWKEKK